MRGVGIVLATDDARVKKFGGGDSDEPMAYPLPYNLLDAGGAAKAVVSPASGCQRGSGLKGAAQEVEVEEGKGVGGGCACACA